MNEKEPCKWFCKALFLFKIINLYFQVINDKILSVGGVFTHIKI